MVVHRIVIRYPQGVLRRHCPLAIQTQTDSLYQKHSMTLPQRTVFGRLLPVIYHKKSEKSGLYIVGPLYIVTILVWHSRGEIRMQNGILNTAALTLRSDNDMPSNPDFCSEKHNLYICPVIYMPSDLCMGKIRAGTAGAQKNLFKKVTQNCNLFRVGGAHLLGARDVIL